MNSTLKCDTVVSIKNLGLLYEVDHYYNRSIKDGLIELCKSPLKKLTEKKREKLFIEIKEKALAWSIAEATHTEIDEMNILQEKVNLKMYV